MKQKILMNCGGFILFCFLTFIIDWFKWDIASDKIAFIGNILLLIHITLLIILVIWFMLLSIKLIKINVLATIILCLFLLFTVTSQTILPISSNYLSANYRIFQEQREQIVEMYRDKILERYRSDIHEYTLPFYKRLLSHTGKIYIEANGGIIFYVHVGIVRCSAVLYIPDGAGLETSIYKKIIHFNKNWYGVVI